MGGTLALTVERYLANGQRIDTTANELVVHPNTLRYRIKRFEDIARCDLREPGSAVEVWWALLRARLDAGSTEQAARRTGTAHTPGWAATGTT